LVSFATDGIDGQSNAAGAIADGNTYSKAKEKNLDFYQYLDENNSYEFFSQLKDTLITGHTGTNVMDIQMIIS
jgi:glycerate-2-kinase